MSRRGRPVHPRITKKTMDLLQLKDNINKAGFSPEGLDLINMIMDKAIKRGKLEKEEKDELFGIIDIEIESAKIVADAKKEIGLALNDFADGVEDAVAKAMEEIKALEITPSAPPKPGCASQENQ